jgi:lipopolysaccharide export system protein LptA
VNSAGFEARPTFRGLPILRAVPILLAVLFLRFLAPDAFATATLQPTNERNAPLIMENADRFEGYRSRGEYVLSGKVRFRHGKMFVETERAVWQKDRNIIFCESGMRITRNGALLTADRGTYDKNLGQATAQGNVFMRDSAGEVAATGQSIVYMRFKHLATLTGNPEVRRFYVDRKPSDSVAAAKASATGAKDTLQTAAKAPADTNDGPAGKKDGPDTLSIKGDIMTYDDSSQVAVADGNVVIHRDKLNITCKKAEYHDASTSCAWACTERRSRACSSKVPPWPTPWSPRRTPLSRANPTCAGIPFSWPSRKRRSTACRCSRTPTAPTSTWTSPIS